MLMSMTVIHQSHPWKSSMTVHVSQITTVSHFPLVWFWGPKKMKGGPQKWKKLERCLFHFLFFLKLPSVHVLIHFSRLVIRSVGRKYRLWWAGQLLGTSQLLSAKIENGRIALYLGEVLNIYLQLCTLGETGTDNLEMFGPYIIFL